LTDVAKHSVDWWLTTEDLRAGDHIASRLA
jgi:hypothetical protein